MTKDHYALMAILLLMPMVICTAIGLVKSSPDKKEDRIAKVWLTLAFACLAGTLGVVVYMNVGG